MDSSKKYLKIPDDLKGVKEAWRKRSLSARIRHMTSIIIAHPDFDEAIKQIGRRVVVCIQQGKGDLFAIVAPTGGGKTTLANYFRDRWKDRIFDEVTWRRVCYFNVPPRPSSSSMSAALLQALGDPVPVRGRTDTRALETRAFHLLKECRTRLVLIDNTHDIPERRKHTGIREVGNWFRNAVDTVPALFVSLGEEQSLEVFKANRQARRRGPAHKRINYFVCDSEFPAETGRYFRALYEIDLRLPLADMCGLALPDFALRIHVATNGVIGLINKLLTNALPYCVREGRESLSLEDLAKGFEDLMMDASPRINPFGPSFEFRPLTQPGEPFHLWLEDGLE